MTSRDVGDRIDLRHRVRDADGALADATVTVVVTRPDGTLLSPAPAVSRSSLGVYDASFLADTAGQWAWTWTATGLVDDVTHGSVDVGDPAPPTYIPLSLLKDSLGITTTDTARDVLLRQKLAAACRSIDDHCGRFFYRGRAVITRSMPAAGRLLDDNNPDGLLLLVDDIADTTGLVVQVRTSRTGAWTTFTDFEPEEPVRPGWPVTGLRGNWTSRSRVRITARPGWPAVPDTVAEAALLQASRLNKRKDTPEGVFGSADWGGAVRMARVDPDVATLLVPFTLR
ncbi:head-tail connector protein [Micromonospora aurantiaca (nom. illeg.)]|uniref:hypothetical protein n=1 Tax=Micromonospora aurantiaca (nom. illeg.) TaxID=47850 RepID=UPI00223C2B7A|nr:hypothetical protein [Micromonospora aurantiaca]